MSLNFDLTECRKRLGEERWNELTTSPDTRDAPEGQQKWHPITDALIWMSMVVDLGSITEKNVDEWCFRLGLLNRIDPIRSDCIGGAGDFRINRKDIENHIGMRTNVSTKTRAQYLTKIFGEGRSDEALCLSTMEGDKSGAEQVNEAVAAYRAAEKGK